MTEYKRIPVKPDTADRIHAEKRYGETWDDLLTRLAEEHGSNQNAQ